MTQERTDLASSQPDNPCAPARPVQETPGKFALSREPPPRPDQRHEQVKTRARKFFRFVRIFGLDMHTTLADIVEGIAQTAPVGRVLSVRFERKTTIKNGIEFKAALVLFDHRVAPIDLQRLARQGSFLVRGACPWVAVSYERSFHDNDFSELSSRVVLLHGRTDVADFSEEGIRDLIVSNTEAMRSLGPLGLESEPVWVRDWDGRRYMEWRFFDNYKQARVFLQILRRYFHKQLSVAPGPDPCWNSSLYPKERQFSKRLTEPGSKPGHPRQARQHRAFDHVLPSPQFESLLSELLGRRQAAKEAAAREQELQLDELSQEEDEDEVREEKREPTGASTRPLSPMEEEKRKRIAMWSEGLRKMSRGRPFGQD